MSNPGRLTKSLPGIPESVAKTPQEDEEFKQDFAKWPVWCANSSCEEAKSQRESLLILYVLARDIDKIDTADQEDIICPGCRGKLVSMPTDELNKIVSKTSGARRAADLEFVYHQEQ